VESNLTCELKYVAFMDLTFFSSDSTLSKSDSHMILTYDVFSLIICSCMCVFARMISVLMRTRERWKCSERWRLRKTDNDRFVCMGAVSAVSERERERVKFVLEWWLSCDGLECVCEV
jgi:hypothetical protein